MSLGNRTLRRPRSRDTGCDVASTLRTRVFEKRSLNAGDPKTPSPCCSIALLIRPRRLSRCSVCFTAPRVAVAVTVLLVVFVRPRRVSSTENCLLNRVVRVFRRGSVCFFRNIETSRRRRRSGAAAAFVAAAAAAVDRLPSARLQLGSFHFYIRKLSCKTSPENRTLRVDS